MSESTGTQPGQSAASGHRVGPWKLSEILLFGGIFLIGLLVLSIHLLTWGRGQIEMRRRYDSTFCVVDRLVRRSLDEGSGQLRYRPEIEVHYLAAGQPYRRLIYDETTWTRDQGFVYSQSEADEILCHYRVGKRYRCYYLSDDPESAVLEPIGEFWGWWFLLIPVTLLVFGLIGLIYRVRLHRTSPEERSIPVHRTELYPTLPVTHRINDSPGTQLAYRLPVFFLPVTQTVVGLMVMLLWVGVSLFGMIYTLVTADGTADILLGLLFGLIFCGAAFAFLPWFIHRYHTAFDIGSTTLEISNHPICPGRKYRVVMMQSGPAIDVPSSVGVVCTEVARYRQGTDTLTNRREVFRLPLLSKTWNVPKGEVESADFFLELPIGVMHSFLAENNQIHWWLVVDFTMADGTVIRRESPLVVIPFSPPDEPAVG